MLGVCSTPSSIAELRGGGGGGGQREGKREGMGWGGGGTESGRKRGRGTENWRRGWREGGWRQRQWPTVLISTLSSVFQAVHERVVKGDAELVAL